MRLRDKTEARFQAFFDKELNRLKNDFRSEAEVSVVQSLVPWCAVTPKLPSGESIPFYGLCLNLRHICTFFLIRSASARTTRSSRHSIVTPSSCRPPSRSSTARTCNPAADILFHRVVQVLCGAVGAALGGACGELSLYIEWLFVLSSKKKQHKKTIYLATQTDINYSNNP